MPTPTKSKPYRFTAARTFGVDRNLGILTNVALITAGVEALGHGIYIDDKTVETAAAVLATRGGRLKAAIRHLSWEDYYETNDDRVEDFPGWFSGIAGAGAVGAKQLVAAKLEFYDTFKNGEETKDKFARILEMAEKTPDLFGISLEPWGYVVYVGKDGVEYSERPKDIELKYDGLPALRVTELFFGAIVDQPAANPGGLFAQLAAKFPNSEVLRFIASVFPGTERDAVLEFVGKQKAASGAAAPALVNSAPVTETASTPTALATASTTAMKDILQFINATFSAEKAKHAQALSIFAAKPEITVEALKVEMDKLDLAAAQSSVTTLTTELAAERKKVTDLTTELAAEKKKFTDLKASGVAGEVALGAAGAAVAGENPWADPVNLTRQAEISLAEPARAEALKAAAKTAGPKK